MLLDAVKKDLFQAMKDKNENAKNILQVVTAEINKFIKESNKEVTDEDQASIIAKEVKSLRGAIELCGSRQDKIDEYNDKIKVLEKYLPKQMTEEEIRKIVLETIDELNEPTKGNVMKLVVPKTKGKADGKLVSSIVDECLR